MISTSKYSSSETSSESDENFPDIEDRYNASKKCSHDACYADSVRSDLQKTTELAEDTAKEESIDLEEKFKECCLDESLGNFTGTECGEPMHSQFLRLDFTPIDGVDDNPHIQKKCSDFWEFLYSQPELQGLVVLPEKSYEEVISPSISETSLKKCEQFATPAVDWLETGVGQKAMFAAKQPIRYCPQQNGDYMEGSKQKKKEATRVETQTDSSETFQTSGSSRTPLVKNRKFSTSNAVDLCSQLDKWDRKHAKSMDPPGRVPNLSHAILQRSKQER